MTNNYSMEAANSQDLVVVKEVKDDVLVLHSGIICQLLMVGGLNFLLKSESEQSAITLAYQDFLNSLDFGIQIVVHSRKINIDRYLQSLDVRREKEPSALLQNQISEYQEFIRSFVKENAIMRKIFLLVIPFYPSTIPSAAAAGSTLSSLNPFAKKKSAAETKAKTAAEEDAEFAKNEGGLRQRVDQVVDGMRTIGLETQVLNNEQLIELFYNLYNPESVEKQDVAMPEQ